jgi:hypothetical protein
MSFTIEQIVLYAVTAFVAIQQSGGLMNWLKKKFPPKVPDGTPPVVPPVIPPVIPPAPPPVVPVPVPAPRATPFLDMLDAFTTGIPIINGFVKAAKVIAQLNPLVSEAELAAPIVRPLLNVIPKDVLEKFQQLK